MTHKLRSAQSEDLSRFNRVEVTLVHHIFKSFDSRNLSPIASMTPSGANCDGESIRFFAKRLEQQKHKRKIMMVFSDGLPSCGGNSQILNSDLKRAVKEITAAGIECVGIGICHDGPKHFYPDFVIIKSLSELTKEALKKLKTILAV
jgi:cobalamin biosynthesis protein CobT